MGLDAFPNKPIGFVVPLAPAAPSTHRARSAAAPGPSAQPDRSQSHRRRTLGMDSAMKSDPDGYDPDHQR
jgi:hypothetical protein